MSKSRRWLKLFPKRREKDGSPSLPPSKPEIDMITEQPDSVTEKRRRLSDIRWWMRFAAYVDLNPIR